MQRFMQRSFLIIFFAFGFLAVYAQEGQIRTNAMFNTLSGASFNPQIQFDAETYLSKIRLGIGVQGSIYNNYQLDKGNSMNDRTINASTHINSAGVYLCGMALNKPNHSLIFGVGYSLGRINESSSSLLQIEHGVLVRGNYDYVFKDGLTLGVAVQYTNYLRFSTSPDLLSIGVAIGYRF